MADSTSIRLPEQDSAEDIEYRSFEPWALLGLVLGLLSPLAMIETVLLFIPLLGLAASVIGLRRLAGDTGRSGRTIALFGLALSMLFGVAPIVQSWTTRAILSGQAREVADEFFQDLQQGHPEKALMLKGTPDTRAGHANDLWLIFRNDIAMRDELLKFIGRPVVRTLLELGPRAHVEYYKTAGAGSEGSRGMVNYWYTVTFDDDEGKKKTFVMGIMLERKPTKTTGINPWRFIDITGAFDPAKF